MICPGCGAEHVALSPEDSVEHVPHLGADSVQWLQQAGIATIAQLTAVGAVAAYMRIDALGVNPGINMLYALHAAISGSHWLEVKRREGAALLATLHATRELCAAREQGSAIDAPVYTDAVKYIDASTYKVPS